MTEVLRTIKNNLDEGETDEFLREAKWIWACIRPYRGVALPHIGLTVLVTVLSLGTGVTTKYPVDSVTGCRVDMLRRAAAAAGAKMMRNLMPCGLIQTGVPVTHRTGALLFWTRRCAPENGRLVRGEDPVQGGEDGK